MERQKNSFLISAQNTYLVSKSEKEKYAGRGILYCGVSKRGVRNIINHAGLRPALADVTLSGLGKNFLTLKGSNLPAQGNAPRV
jgi:hypothetical protein